MRSPLESALSCDDRHVRRTCRGRLGPRPYFDLSLVNSRFVAGLRGNCRSSDNGSVLDAEAAGVPWADDFLAFDLALVERSATMTATVSQRMDCALRPVEQHVIACDGDLLRTSIGQFGCLQDSSPVANGLFENGVVDTQTLAERQVSAEESRGSERTGTEHG